jgi:serine/threonine-protein kinase
MDLTGRVLNGKYQVIEQLGEGGMSIIYKARHMMLDEYCAVKVIRDSERTKEKMLKRFELEAKTTWKLAQRSPYIVSIFDFGIENDIGFFYVMEILNGYPLSALLNDPANTPPMAWTCELICQMCEALDVVHQEGLIHRDIKSDNVFLHWPAGSDNAVVKLLDFGIVRPIYSEGSSGLTTYGNVLGTPEYMSPEQCRGPSQAQHKMGISHLDARSDIYSLGILFYQCLTGWVPFPMTGPNALNASQVMAGHVMNPITHPNQLRPDLPIPPVIADVVLRALEKEPDARYQSMLEFRDAIRTNIHTVPT